MTAYLKLKPNDVISTKYKTHPSYNLVISGSGNSYRSSYFYIDSEGAETYGQRRTYFDIRGRYITGSWNLSGAVEVVLNAGLTAPEKRSLNRLRNIYASGSYVREYNYTSSSVFSASTVAGQFMTLVNIPSALYGTEIKPGSFWLSGTRCPTLTDDSHGGILSNSVLIGSIYYQHGIVLLGHHAQVFETALSNSTIVFSGTSEIPCNMYICTAPRGMLNFSNNTSFFVENTSSHKNEITTKKPETFITTVRLYDEDYELVGIAKVSKPIMNEEDVSISFRLKLNF